MSALPARRRIINLTYDLSDEIRRHNLCLTIVLPHVAGTGEDSVTGVLESDSEFFHVKLRRGFYLIASRSRLHNVGQYA